MKRQDKIKDFKRLDKAGLTDLILVKKERMRQLRFDLATGKVKNVREIRENRRDVALLNTLLKKI
ncbi:50S ribosomal protein L29 [bacterium (Candidatus Gribaldobacteria) CG10_big_fil_rev_8_21_14_0_10_41_12]|uniref:Large ribosomal subunit protein uL29 n=1 Tax=bacterium (Candidatus Gribaldobacteria) CG10_big_fil_rev_8_21_14_0_10_41_12 TaxID=2014277 RepID=A0A2H0UYF4_9BACT|nr:MAG: 50S ribosomal protein L29 [Parcubacteria group bacterium CG1_02_41_26]PIR91827.1 MAG: 50S ribosomal protein L29 [bacterium (Candidatus Gribaldobacteria) CG10_big_fil_rev_8_21_14_0_10_41_12]